MNLTCRKLVGFFLAFGALLSTGSANADQNYIPLDVQMRMDLVPETLPVTEEFQLASKQRLRKRKPIADPSLPSAGGNNNRRIGRQAYRWFWQEVSPSRNAASAARWAAVMQVLEKGRRTGKPIYGSRSLAQRIMANYGEYLKREAKRRNVSIPFLIAVIAVESNGNSKARSHVGAQGLMQLMPFTAARFGVSNSYAPSQNIRGGATYLDWLLRRFRNDAVLALAGYNAGEGAVDKHRGVPPYRETRDYVVKVAGAFSAARYLCKRPPSSPRDPCELR